MTERVNFKDKISRERPYPGALRENFRVPACSVQDLIDQFESDRGRILNSAAIRRLQQKTQVFPLERNAAVRSRLTHSLEVQQTGRFIVKTLYKQLGERAAEFGLDGLEGAVESLVEMSCLMHDMGNPPFGHFGEYAINAWFERHLDGLFERAVPAPGDAALRGAMLRDLKNFEGNAQAIRLAVRLLRLNLTYTQTAGLLKYVRPASQPKPERGSPGAYLNKKPGYYLSESDYIDAQCAALAMPPGTRHPLTYIMEAADDISYCLADIEDSVEKGILDIDRLAQMLTEKFASLSDAEASIPGARKPFRAVVDYALQRAHRETVNKTGEFFIWLRVGMTHPLVKHAAAQFIEHIEDVYHGRLDRALMEDGGIHQAMVDTFKEVAREQVFSHREVETLELQGFRILQGLLDFYAPLMAESGASFRALAEGSSSKPLHLRLLIKRLADTDIKAYLEALRQLPEGDDPTLWEFYHRCRLLQDFVSGLTDQSAHDEYRTLSAL
ncbi:MULTISPECIES: dGTPase [Pseudomonas]|uniref:Probable deoxyguanosinetriphosphate triphosphohydrolase n=1 Tax=Pseudomonas kuykendallii TaxID=1007099 RepID=A0A2W5D9K4_9PSED|nr:MULTISPECIES: dGTPase [Pseudomonas]PZP25757.1 MAG: dGTPase [Pseudomonas kuykendallii]